MRKTFTLLGSMGLLTLLAGASCSESNPTGAGDPSDELVIEPIHIERVDVLILESFPPQATAHVRGVVGDGCSELHSVQQERSGGAVTMTILRQRPREAVCIQIAKLYDEHIRLEGNYPPGEYVLSVNDFVTTFTTQ